MVPLKLTAIFLFCCVYSVSANSCSFNLKELKTEAIILTSKDGGELSYFQPESKTPEIEAGTNVLLLCAGKKNKLTKTGKQSIELTCKNGKFLDPSGKAQTIEELQCKKIPTAEMKETEESCADGKANIFKAGWTYNEDQFYTLYEVCYNKDSRSVYYTHHTVHGKSIAYSISESKRTAFTAEGMGTTTTKINKLYTTKHQIAQFQKIFGEDQTYVSKKHFIARGHLNPDADGVFRAEQFATYFYINCQPQFQDNNAGNWLRIETMTRNIAEKHETDLDVWTGVMGELQFEDKNGNLKTAYIDDDELMPVPRYFFKVVTDLKKKASIVFISENNPWAKEAKPFCKNICKEQGVEHADFARLDRGPSFCCSLPDFLKHYKDLPKSVTAKKVLSL